MFAGGEAGITPFPVLAIRSSCACHQPIDFAESVSGSPEPERAINLLQRRTPCH
jgi:hypothetical protein